MNTTALFKPRSLLRRAEDVPGFPSAQGTVLGPVGKKPDRWPVAFPILAQLREQVLRQDRIAVLPAFTPFHADGHALRIDVCDLEVHQLTDSESCRIRGHQQNTLLETSGGTRSIARPRRD